MALTKSTFDRYSELFDDELVKNAFDELDEIRANLREWVQENKPLKECPVCGNSNIRSEWNKRVCNDCGWYEDIDVPVTGGKEVTKEFYSILKKKFGFKLGKFKNDNKIKPNEIKYIPMDLVQFDTGEYTDTQIEFLENRFKDIMEDEEVEFSKRDLPTVHFLVLQELKLKELYRRDAITSNNSLDKDFTQIKKNELSVYNDLKDDINEIIESQRTSDKDKSLNEQISSVFQDEDIEDILDRYGEKQKYRKEKLEKSERRRKQVLDDNIDIEEELSKIDGVTLHEKET